VTSQITSPIRLCTLGAIELRAESRGELRAVLRQPKRIALLAYLAVATPHGFQRRDTLVGLFWPGLDDEHARGALRQAVRFLRRHLGEKAVVGRGEEELALGDEVWCDAVAFERAASEDRPDEAPDLYRGDFLAGFFVSDAAPEFDEWIEAERARLRSLAAKTAWARAVEAPRDDARFPGRGRAPSTHLAARPARRPRGCDPSLRRLRS
jgi:serine/threonine-protein kinase